MTGPEIAAVVRGIADDIETHGHWKPWLHAADDLYGRGGDYCCVVLNPTKARLHNDEWDDVRRALWSRIGVRPFPTWSDETPTDVLLDQLRRAAADIEAGVAS